MELGLPLPFHLGSFQKFWSTPRVLSTDISWKEGGSSSNAKPCDEGRAVPCRNTTMCPALLILEEVNNYAFAQGMSDRSLALAEVSPSRPVLGARVRTADGAALTVGLVLLLTNADGHHADGTGFGPDRDR
jgi:hypothetical protein